MSKQKPEQEDSFDEYLNDRLRDPEFKKHYDKEKKRLDDVVKPEQIPERDGWRGFQYHAGYLHLSGCYFPTEDQAVCNCPPVKGTKNSTAFVRKVEQDARRKALENAYEVSKKLAKEYADEDNVEKLLAIWECSSRLRSLLKS